MTLERLILENVSDTDISPMKSLTKLISDFIENNVQEEARNTLMKKTYGLVGGGHFNEYFANEQIADMYYMDGNGVKHYAPYWTEGELRSVYDSKKDDLAPYNFYDFIVVMNMSKSDQFLKLKRWFPTATDEELLDKIIDESITWLDDTDNPYGDKKAWGYFNGLQS